MDAYEHASFTALHSLCRRHELSWTLTYLVEDDTWCISVFDPAPTLLWHGTPRRLFFEVMDEALKKLQSIELVRSIT